MMVKQKQLLVFKGIIMKNWNDLVLEEANKIMFYKNPRGCNSII
jgi:hypothetical protein